MFQVFPVQDGTARVPEGGCRGAGSVSQAHLWAMLDACQDVADLSLQRVSKRTKTEERLLEERTANRASLLATRKRAEATELDIRCEGRPPGKKLFCAGCNTFLLRCNLVEGGHCWDGKPAALYARCKQGVSSCSGCQGALIN